jgi:SET domain-containing protein
MLRKNVVVKKIRGKGRGVIAAEPIRRGQVIEEAELIILSEKELKRIMGTKLYDYTFEWGREGAAIALGYGGLYNHAYDANAEYLRDMKAKRLVFQAVRDIAPGEEICTNYNGEPGDRKLVWFDEERKKRKKGKGK